MKMKGISVVAVLGVLGAVCAVLLPEYHSAFCSGGF